MNSFPVLIFDVRGAFGHFRKPYTTTSPLTYPFPPRTALCGLLGAIMGIERSEYSEAFHPDKCKIALRILNSIRKMKIGTNYLDTENPKSFYCIKGRKPLPLELLTVPEYRIYFHHSDYEFQKKLKKYLKNHETEFTPSLGLSQMLADFEFVGESNLDWVEKDEPQIIDIHSVVPLMDSLEILFYHKTDEEPGEYFSSKMPGTIEEKEAFNRQTLDYLKVIYERRGRPISCKTRFYGRLEKPHNENILFL